MKRILAAAAAFLLTANLAHAQWPPVGSGTGTGSADPAQFSSPAGTLVIGGSTGAVTLDQDTTVTFLRAEGTSTPATCVARSIWNYRTDTSILEFCKATNTFVKVLTADLTSTSGFGFVVDEDTMTSNSDTKVPTQQSVKSYVDTAVAGAATTFNPGTVVELYDDFVTGTTTTGQVGQTGAGVAAIATGTVSQVASTSTNNPGLIRLNSHATNDNSGEVVYFGNSNSSNSWPPGVYGTNGDWTFDAVIAIGTASTAITNTAFFAGLSGSYTTDVSNNTVSAIMVRRDTDLSETGAFKFVICNASGASGCNSASDAANAKVMASTISPSAGTFYRIRIRRLISGVGGNETIYFRINEETEKTACSSGCDTTLGTKPTTGLTPMVQYLTRTTTSVMAADVDYLYFRLPGLSRY